MLECCTAKPFEYFTNVHYKYVNTAKSPQFGFKYTVANISKQSYSEYIMNVKFINLDSNNCLVKNQIIFAACVLCYSTASIQEP